MDLQEDHELVRRIRSTDRVTAESAFDALYRKYRDRVFGIAVRILNDRGLAADATQATFLAVFRKLRQFDFRSAFSSWLFRVTVNQSLDLRRRRANVARVSLDDPAIAATATIRDFRRSEPGDPGEEADRAELTRLIRRALASLRPRHTAVLVLRYMEGFSYDEIAEILDVPVGTVRSRLSRAHVALQEILGHSLDEYL
ncbi:MAG: sigma-70 family RNA polymerase sigma factor [Planctomycetes bacterium]|nr:sigma-70 family RNA polymerase sigma factor [Planctomycetota bacterium]